MSLGMTVWLWVMAAAVIPVMIHLWSRKSGKPKMLPTFRFLPEKSIARASRIELHEKTLLFLRILLVLLVTLLLAGLFFDGEPQQFRSLKITETDSETAQSIENENVLELQVPSAHINRVGWFRLIEQAEYDYRPGLIVVEGHLTANRFTGKLPELSADVEWIASDLPDMFQGGSWKGSDNNLFSYIQTRTDSLIESKIEPANDAIEGNLTDSLMLTINSNLGSAQKTGFEQTAAMWKIDVAEADLSSDKLAEVQYGDRQIGLDGLNLQTLSEDYLMPGPHFGIQLPVFVVDSNQAEWTSLRSNMEVITNTNAANFQLAAVPDAPYTQWFYAGVAHQLLRAAVGIDDRLYLELAEYQRQPLVSEQPARAGMVEKESADPYLLVLIVLVWAGERVLSYRRGM